MKTLIIDLSKLIGPFICSFIILLPLFVVERVVVTECP